MGWLRTFLKEGQLAWPGDLTWHDLGPKISQNVCNECPLQVRKFQLSISCRLGKAREKPEGGLFGPPPPGIGLKGHSQLKSYAFVLDTACYPYFMCPFYLQESSIACTLFRRGIFPYFPSLYTAVNINHSQQLSKRLTHDTITRLLKKKNPAHFWKASIKGWNSRDHFWKLYCHLIYMQAYKLHCAF